MILSGARSGAVDLEFFEKSDFLKHFYPLFLTYATDLMEGTPELKQQSLAQLLQVTLDFEELIQNTPRLLEESKQYQTKLHTQLIESPHPYDIAQVYKQQVKFPENVRWLLLNFSDECSSMQPEDMLAIYTGSKR
jgi:hypothetical protein